MSRLALSFVAIAAAVASAQQQSPLTQAPAPTDPNNPIAQPSPLQPSDIPPPASIPAGLTAVPTGVDSVIQTQSVSPVSSATLASITALASNSATLTPTFVSTVSIPTSISSASASTSMSASMSTPTPSHSTSASSSVTSSGTHSTSSSTASRSAGSSSSSRSASSSSSSHSHSLSESSQHEFSSSESYESEESGYTSGAPVAALPGVAIAAMAIVVAALF